MKSIKKSLSINNKTRKNNYNKKINLIFDIDETLIQAYYNESGVMHSYDRGEFIVGKLGNGKEYLIYLRPYLKKLLNFCYKHFYVSFWTNGKKDHCLAVLNGILTKEQFKKTRIILARVDQNEVCECNTNKNYIINLHNYQINKPLDYLWDHPDFNSHFKRNNTIIIDDNPINIAINQSNSIFIYPWCRFDKNDRKLKSLIKLLKKHKKTTNVKDIKTYTLHIPRKLSITEVTAHHCGMEHDKRETKKLVSKFN